MTQISPSLNVALVPAAYALYRYDRAVAGVVGALVFVVALTLASWPIGLYGLCVGC